MAMSKETKAAIQAKLRIGSTPKDVSELFGVGIQTVYLINQQMKKGAPDELVQKLHELPTEAISHVVEEAKRELYMSTPSAADPTIKAFEAVAAGADGLKKLDGAFQTTMMGVLRRFDLMLLEPELPLKDIKLISDTAAVAYEKIFSSGTNIHIGDNNSQSSQQLTVFKSKQGV